MSLPDIRARIRNVRFTPKADILSVETNVRYVPIADINRHLFSAVVIALIRLVQFGGPGPHSQ